MNGVSGEHGRGAGHRAPGPKGQIVRAAGTIDLEFVQAGLGVPARRADVQANETRLLRREFNGAGPRFGLLDRNARQLF